ncbi:SIS domain-containing protein [Testudinibacter sp. TR-2022]|uniref:D-sedoheptulose-7-phosphate isomerase n=1 Tax=Testudinibacter sp. TR-2022 TaxID=2585029 RepID=UPI001118D14A|nr:SIS domain-containing protein [Testudinibacter sp. TR-2022]TNH03490.1 SIS domain-containing protein [Pasteurellaceae bacterium Phil31]TNH07938.1 SIS domain-containing protein [Testudinibacter sp. TR-2022]TNH10325.1 SIS domain-containing protein [Testudinibacter sp. TR-2022]TNH13607.1 SIS domain-containing protein [Testudinibacter sp. TR-2022]TNH20811.1 SIS domain-containing protein [Testudinibacter sp. TR-2022]
MNDNNLLDKVKNTFTESIQTQISATESLSESIVQASEMLVGCLLDGHKIIVCGNGRSNANAQFLVTNLLHRYHLERPSLPAILIGLDGALGASIIADNNPAQIFLRQFECVAQPGDVLILLSPQGREEAVLNLIHAANSKELPIITLTGRQNDHIRGALGEDDLDISIPAQKEARIIENHLLVINILCDLIEHRLFSH